MELLIDTSDKTKIVIGLQDRKTKLVEATIEARRAQGEKLLPAIAVLVKKFKKYGEIKQIVVADRGEGFSSLRIGVTVANALGYALGIPVLPLGQKKPRTKKQTIVLPRYSSPPKIGKH